MLAGAGIAAAMSDLFGLAGQDLLEELRFGDRLAPSARAGVVSARRVIDLLDGEIDRFQALTGARLGRDPGFRAVQTIPGVGEVLGAIFVAEIGALTRFRRAAGLISWTGLTPRHHESDTTSRRGRITGQGSELVRPAAIEAVQILPKTSYCGAIRHRARDRRGAQHRQSRRCPRTG
ncbi:MAG: transposase [Mycobacteriales bacterium]